MFRCARGLLAATPDAQRDCTQSDGATAPSKELLDDLPLAGDPVEQLRTALVIQPVEGGQAQARGAGDNRQTGLKANAEDAVKHEQA